MYYTEYLYAAIACTQFAVPVDTFKLLSEAHTSAVKLGHAQECPKAAATSTLKLQEGIRSGSVPAMSEWALLQPWDTLVCPSSLRVLRPPGTTSGQPVQGITRLAGGVPSCMVFPPEDSGLQAYVPSIWGELNHLQACN